MAWSNVGNFLRGSFPLFPGLFTSAAILISAKTCDNYPGTNAGVDGTSGTIEGRRILLAMLLTCAGIYGVLSFVTARRRREMGIRVALGATRFAIIRLVVGV